MAETSAQPTGELDGMPPAAAPKASGGDKPPRGDRKPDANAGEKKPRGRPKGSTNARASKETNKRLEDALAEILTMPSLGFAIVGDEFCADHFAEMGPRFAKRLVDVSERHEQLRAILERMVTGETVAVLLLDGFAYMMPPLIHHGLPVPPGLRRMMRVPEPLPSPRDARRANSETQPGAQDAPGAEAPEA